MTLRAPFNRLKQLVVDKIGAARCGGRHGHDYTLCFYRDRWFLRCCSCGEETEGFRIGKKVRS